MTDNNETIESPEDDESRTEALDALIARLSSRKPEVKTFTLEEAAKLYGYPDIGRNKLFRILRQTGHIDSNNLPYQKYLNDGLFHVELIVTCKGDKLYTYSQTQITLKGMSKLERVISDYIERF